MPRGYNSENLYEPKPNHTKETVNSSSKSFIGKTFLYMFFGLLVTLAVAGALGFVYKNFFPLEGVTEENINLFGGVYLAYSIVLFIDVIALVIISIVIDIKILKNSKRVPLALFFVYAGMIGILISSLTMFIPFETTLLSVGITTLAFGAMALIGFFAKKVNGVVIAISGLLIGALILALVCLIFSLINPVISFAASYATSMIFFVIIMLITIVDMFMVKSIAASGGQSDNMALYCAMRLYNDFIYILIRILIILARSRR